MNLKFAIAFCLSLFSVVVCAQQPETIKAVPIYPGATRYQPAPGEDVGATPRLAQEVSKENLVYQTNASAEEVYAWYRQKLKAKRIDAPVTLDDDGKLPVRCFASPYEDADFKDSVRVMSDENYEGDWIRDQLKAKRKLLEGAYVKLGSFTWTYIDEKDRPHNLSVAVVDRSFAVYRGDAPLSDGSRAVGKKNYRQVTLILITEAVTMAPPDSEEESED
jgi:hypothetical protein